LDHEHPSAEEGKEAMDKVETLFTQFRDEVNAELERLGYSAFQLGFEHATEMLDELSNREHNKGNTSAAEVLRSAAKELRGEDETQPSIK
jgi:hypothetical protein